MLHRRQLIEAGTCLFLATILGQFAGNRQLAGKVRMGPQYRQTFLSLAARTPATRGA